MSTYPNTSPNGLQSPQDTTDWPESQAAESPINVPQLQQHMAQMAQMVSQLPDPVDEPVADPESTLLTYLLDRQSQLKQAAEKPVVFSPPLISQQERGIIGRNTINVIQGHYGSHKSRLAELLAALMLSTGPGSEASYLGFTKPALERFWLCYIDTERNHTEELPYALQQIKLKAGYALEQTPENFRFTSIKDVLRKDRMKAVEAFLKYVRSETEHHLFVVLDVVTDCVGSFNDDEQAMKLFDFIGNLCDRHNATFLLVIHQNPGSDKARGHTGTEAANKAATVLQIGYEQSANGQDTDLIRLRYLKLRHSKRPEPLYLQYSEEAKGLVIANAGDIAQHVSQRKHKADLQDIVEELENLLFDGPRSKGEVIAALEEAFGARNATIRDRLKTVREQLPPMHNKDGQPVRLDEIREGQKQYYRLLPLDESPG